jgi:hypothetical protein
MSEQARGIEHEAVPQWAEELYYNKGIFSDAGQEDTYLSTQRFRDRRRIAHLLSLGALYADLDYYRVPEFAGVHTFKVLEMALSALEKVAMPELRVVPSGSKITLRSSGSVPKVRGDLRSEFCGKRISRVRRRVWCYSVRTRRKDESWR